MTQQAIERRDSDSLSQILGTGDTRAALERLEQNARDVIDLARARGHVRRFGNAQTEHFGLPAWQLLGFTYGLVTVIDWSRAVENGWEARATVKTRDGMEVGSAEAMCTRSEANWRNKPDNDLRSMSQTRARRNALRGVLGAFLVLTGFDFADPEQPANDDQVGILHMLERQLGWSHEEGHRQADVQSYKDLTREQAHETIEAWAARLEAGSSTALHPHSTPTPDGETGEERPDKRTGEDAAAVKSSPAGRTMSPDRRPVATPAPARGGLCRSGERPAPSTGTEGEGEGLSPMAATARGVEDLDAAGVGAGRSKPETSPAGRKGSAAPQASSSRPEAADGPAAGSGRPAAGPQSDHRHDWGPAPSAEMAKRGWRVCGICRKAIGPGEVG